MIRVAALTSGRNVPSTRFRVRQHIEPLRAQGFEVREYTPAINKYSLPRPWPPGVSLKYLPQFYVWQAAKLATRLPGVWGSWRAEITWLERQILPGYLTLEPLLRRPIVFDADDAIWTFPPFARSAVAATARRAAVVVAGNRFLADWFSQHARDVRVVPTAVDTERFRPAAAAGARHERFVIAWTGSAVGLWHLEGIEDALARFLAAHPDAELRVIADRAPRFTRLPAERVRFLPWSPAVEAEAVRSASVGIMPLLRDDDEMRGKCSFKMLQYMACALPVVVSPVGMNAEVLALGEIGHAARSADEWLEAFELLYRDRAAAAACGRAGREIVEQHFSRRVVSRRLGEIFSEVAQRC